MGDRSLLHPAVRRVRRAIRRHGLADSGDRIAVALSGGSDSVALAFALLDLTAAGAPFEVAGFIHVNHGLRGPASDEDERFCRALAARLALPIEVRRLDVQERMTKVRQSVEAAARDLRYAAFEDAAPALGATRVATGHTSDDQAETVLLRLFRGAGSRGVSAIRPRRGRYIRPLLDSRRDDLRAYLTARGETFCDDASNGDMRIPRNHLRRHILPAITAEWPGAVPALARFAELAQADEAFLARTALEVAPAVTLPALDGVQRIDTRGLTQLPASLSRRIVRRAIEQAGGLPSFRDVEAVRALAGARASGRRLDVGGVEVERDRHVLTVMAARPAAARTAGFEYTLTVPGLVRIAETGTTIQASLITGLTERPPDADAVSMAALQADQAAGPLTVRSRRPGDRFRPFGAPGTRKLQDVLVDRKIPRRERDDVPLVVDGNGRILWVVGVALAEDARVRRPESGMVVLNVTKGNQ